MIPFLFIFCVSSALGLPSVTKESSKGWSALRSELPEPVAEYAEKSGLSTKILFQNTVINKLYTEVQRDSEQLQARQKILEEYVRCSCPVCEANEMTPPAAARQLRPLNSFSLSGAFHAITHPQQTIVELLQSCDSNRTLEIVKLLRGNVLHLQKQNAQLTALVACNCPSAKTCRKVLDPLIFSVVSGQNDTQLTRAYWQENLEGAPNMVGKGIVDRLTAASSTILSYFFQSFRPVSTTTPSPPSAGPLSSPPVGPAPPVPPIFAPGEDPSVWYNPDHSRRDCPHVQVNVSTGKKDELHTVTTSTDGTEPAETTN